MGYFGFLEMPTRCPGLKSPSPWLPAEALRGPSGEPKCSNAFAYKSTIRSYIPMAIYAKKILFLNFLLLVLEMVVLSSFQRKISLRPSGVNVMLML